MTISREQVQHVARLARLSFTDDELERFTRQLSQILSYADQVSALAIEDVSPTAHAIPLRNVFRPDEVGECLPADKALGIGPEVEEGRFKVPRIMEEPR